MIRRDVVYNENIYFFFLGVRVLCRINSSLRRLFFLRCVFLEIYTEFLVKVFGICSELLRFELLWCRVVCESVNVCVSVGVSVWVCVRF